ncbi:MAG TPA: GNVR domain-containing protein [Candidatus Hydrogenedentes bacterium]|nr:GNVR domain-containing protein [Candidatus Hydrogenedentota bacterium]HOL77664.1 GNVR domain-containing protein [Candidatus Hydrogenedentota bacterium]HPO86706.1 GNVR domain-containing protein [Candidatus Hydrogenedentota bacterium]
MSSDIVASTTPENNETIRLSLKTVILALWDSRKLVVASVVIAAVASAVISLLLPEEFESSSTVLVTSAPFKNVQEQTGLFPRTIGVQDYALLLMQDAVLKEVVEKVNSAGLLTPEQFEELSRPSVLRKKMEIEVTVNEKTAYGTKNSPALLLIARGPSPEIAQALAQTWGEVAQEKSIELFKKSKGDQARYLLEQSDTTRKQWTQVLDALEKNEAAFSEEEAKNRLHAMTQLYSELENDRYRILIDIDSSKKEIQALETEISGEERVLSLFNSPPMTAVFLDKKLVPPSPGKNESVGYWSEILNPLYTSLSEILAQRKAQLAGKEERLLSLERNLNDLKNKIEEHQKEMAKFRHEKRQLEMEESISNKYYLELASQYQQAKMAEVEEQTMADIRLVADAIAPDRKVAPQRTLIVILAVFLAFSASVCWSIARHVVHHILAGT